MSGLYSTGFTTYKPRNKLYSAAGVWIFHNIGSEDFRLK